VQVARDDLQRRHQHCHPHRHREHRARRFIAGIPPEVQRADRADDQSGGEVGAEHSVHEPIRHRRVEDDAEPVLGHELAGGVHGVARRRVHPAVRGQDPERRYERTRGHGQRRREVQTATDALEAEQHHAEEPRFEEERGEHLVRHQRPDHRPRPIGERRPVRAELVGHDDPGHDTHREGDREDLEPILEQGEIRVAAGAQPERLEHGEIARQPDREGGEDEVEGNRERELDSREREGVQAIQHALAPGARAGVRQGCGPQAL
jgi:hypothetical protein